MNLQQRAEDMLVGALEGGSNYWIERIRSKAPKGTEFYPGLLQHGMTLWVSQEWPDEPQEVHEVSPAALAEAMQLLHDKFPHHYAAILNEEDDAYTADAWLQMAVFKDLIFG